MKENLKRVGGPEFRNGMGMKAMFRRVAPTRPCVLIATVVLALSGCGWQQPRQKSQWQGNNSRTTVSLPARQLVELARRAIAEPPLSLSVEGVQDGVVLTGWKEYPGDVHIVRRWYERTRFRINVAPAFNDPAGQSQIWVEDQTEERATERQPWYPAPQTHRPERGKQVVEQILAHVH